MADAQVVIPLPDHVEFEDAATLGLAGFTAAQCLWQYRDLPTPFESTQEALPVA